MCGWLKDQFGVSWQIVPSELGDMMSSADAERARRVTEALLQMRKLDIAELRRAYEEASCRMADKMTVDEFVATKVSPDLQPIVGMIRALMQECAPQAKEIISYGIPAYRVKNIIAVISPTKKDITFAFSRGAEFEDPHGLLQGVGKVSKHVKIKNLADDNRDALRYYIQQALEFDEK